jgi:hypothetical protein
MKNWIIATLVALAIVTIVWFIGHLINIDLKFLEGWFGASGYFITLNLLEDRDEKM